MAIRQGANTAELRALAKSFAQSGTRLESINAAIQGMSTVESWQGQDAEQFRANWNRQSRPALAAMITALKDTAKTLTNNADAQDQASAAQTGAMSAPGASGPGLPGGAAGPSGAVPAAAHDSNPLDPIAAAGAKVQAWLPYGVATTTISAAGFTGDRLVASMADAGLVTKDGGQLAEVGYLKGMQTINATRLAGQGMSVLGVVGGAAQIYDGFNTGNGYEAADGVVTTILSAGAIAGPAAPVFVAAGLVWGGAGILASSLGYSSTSAMFVDAGKSLVDAGSEAVSAVADGAKAAWNWLTG